MKPLLPPSAVVEELHGAPEDIDLWPGEERYVAAAVDRRRREFAAVRTCARRAMVGLGRAPAPVLRGEKGEPCWPAGLVGSMTHCRGYAAAALGRADDLLGIGIDAEPHSALPPDVLRLVTLAAERDHLARLLEARPEICWDRLLFSAKESVYKTWFPVRRSWLGFHDVQIEFAEQDGIFTAQVLAPAPGDDLRLTHLRGRWHVAAGIAATAIAVAAEPERPASTTLGPQGVS